MLMLMLMLTLILHFLPVVISLLVIPLFIRFLVSVSLPLMCSSRSVTLSLARLRLAGRWLLTANYCWLLTTADCWLAFFSDCCLNVWMPCAAHPLVFVTFTCLFFCCRACSADADTQLLRRKKDLSDWIAMKELLVWFGFHSVTQLWQLSERASNNRVNSTHRYPCSTKIAIERCWFVGDHVTHRRSPTKLAADRFGRANMQCSKTSHSVCQLVSIACCSPLVRVQFHVFHCV